MCAGKIVRLRQKLVDLADSVKGFFGAKKQQDSAVEKLERLKVQNAFPPLRWMQHFSNLKGIVEACAVLLMSYQCCSFTPES